MIQDFSQVNELSEFRARVIDIHSKIDILVLNHAAIPLGPWTAFPNQQDPNFVLRVFNINVLSLIELTRLFLADLELSQGLIQVTGSLSGWLPHYEAGLYTATKHAVNGFFYSLRQELEIKQSSVSLSVFSLGLIMTPEMDTLLSSEAAGQEIPDFVKGDVEECGKVIVGAALSRPRNVDYPPVLVKVVRFLSYVFPQAMEMWSVSSVAGVGYSEVVQIHSRLHDLGDQIKYQVGNK